MVARHEMPGCARSHEQLRHDFFPAFEMITGLGFTKSHRDKMRHPPPPSLSRFIEHGVGIHENPIGHKRSINLSIKRLLCKLSPGRDAKQAQQNSHFVPQEAQPKSPAASIVFDRAGAPIVVRPVRASLRQRRYRPLARQEAHQGLASSKLLYQSQVRHTEQPAWFQTNHEGHRKFPTSRHILEEGGAGQRSRVIAHRHFGTDALVLPSRLPLPESSSSKPNVLSVWPARVQLPFVTNPFPARIVA